MSLFLLRLFWHFAHSLLDICACCHGGSTALAHTIAKIVQNGEFESTVIEDMIGQRWVKYPKTQCERE